MNYNYQEINTNEQELSEITRFLNLCFPKNEKFTPDFIRWQYAQNPLGRMKGYNALDNGQIISHFAGLPIDLNIFGKNRKGLLCINVSTDERYRGKKLFTELGNRTIKYAADNGFDFLIAVPNANSTHGFLKYFGFYLISPLTVKLGIGTNIYNRTDYNCYKIWDETQWQWRLNNPTNKYSYKKGLISTPITLFTKSLSVGKLPQGFSFNDIGFRPFNLYIGLGADTSKGIYLDIPTFIKKPPFNLVFKDLTGEIPILKKEDVFLQLIDLDTI